MSELLLDQKSGLPADEDVEKMGTDAFRSKFTTIGKKFGPKSK